MARPARPRVLRTESGQFIAYPDDQPSTVATTDTGGTPVRGHRPMKEYYIYDSELQDLSRTGAFATALFALGSACLGYWFNIQVGLALTEKVAPEIVVQWSVYRSVAAVGAIVCYVVGAGLALSGYNRVEQLKAETLHGPERYRPKPWYRIALFLLTGVGLVLGGIYVGARWI